MKKITSDVEGGIEFKYDSATDLVIDSEGVEVSDEVADVVKARLGDHVTVTDLGPSKPVAGDDGSANTTNEPTLESLKARAKELGVKQSGSKKDLANRIEEEEKRIADEAAKAEDLAARGKKLATQEDLDANPALVEAGTKVGDEIDVAA